MSTKGIEMPNELELYPHNEKAYRKLLDMLSETRRACIIHPTGTGKAFIAYRYAFDHPKERILWMSPSTYIEQECCMYDLQRAIEGGWEYKGFHFEYMVPPSISGER